MAIYRGVGGSGDATNAAAVNQIAEFATAAEAAAAAALVSENATAADLVQTNLDQIQTTSDAAATAADLVQTNLDQIQTTADAAATAADRVQTNLDRIATAADLVATNQDTIDTAADVVAAEDSNLEAGDWANQLEDSLTRTFSSGIPTDRAAGNYSALHWAAKASSDATATAADLVATNQDTIDTAADLVLTNADVAITHADVVLTNADAASTAADVILTNADVVTTNADAATTTQDAIDTAADAAATAADLVQTNLDQIATTADAAATAADAIATAADKVATNADVVLTNADVVLTNADAAATAAALDEFTDTYLGAKASDPTLDNDGNALIDGALYFDTTSNILKVYDLGNTVWVQISNYTHPDHTGDVTSTGDGATVIANDAVTYAKMQNISATARVLGRNTVGAGDAEEITETQFKTLFNLEVGTDVQAYDATNVLDADVTYELLNTNGDVGTTAGTLAIGDHLHTGVYEPADATIVKDADIGVTVQGYTAVLAATTASFLTADETKLDGIEALADVTDTANVTAAGALMDSEVDADIKTLVLPASTTISTFGASLIDDAAAVNARATLGLTIGTDVQAYDATIVVDADIGSTVQAYDVDTAKLDVVQSFTAEQTFKEYAETQYSLTGTDIDPANGSLQYKTLSANTTFTESMADGQSVTLMIDDGTAYTITWPTTTWVGGAAPTLPTTGYAVIELWQINAVLYGLHSGDA